MYPRMFAPGHVGGTPLHPMHTGDNMYVSPMHHRYLYTHGHASSPHGHVLTSTKFAAAVAGIAAAGAIVGVIIWQIGGPSAPIVDKLTAQAAVPDVPAVSPDDMTKTCGRIADTTSRDMAVRARKEKSEMMDRLHTFLATISGDSDRRSSIQALLDDVQNYSVAPADIKGSGSTRIEDLIAKYNSQLSRTGSWEVALRSYNERAAAIGVALKIFANDGGKLKRCEDLAVDSCSPDHCNLLATSKYPSMPTTCASTDQYFSCWIVPPVRDDAWDSCSDSSHPHTGGNPIFNDRQYSTGVVLDELTCGVRLSWWRNKCAWKRDEGAYVVYTTKKDSIYDRSVRRT
jgi:hypothetical protein